MNNVSALRRLTQLIHPEYRVAVALVATAVLSVALLVVVVTGAWIPFLLVVLGTLAFLLFSRSGEDVVPWCELVVDSTPATQAEVDIVISRPQDLVEELAEARDRFTDPRAWALDTAPRFASGAWYVRPLQPQEDQFWDVLAIGGADSEAVDVALLRSQIDSATTLLAEGLPPTEWMQLHLSTITARLASARRVLERLLGPGAGHLLQQVEDADPDDAVAALGNRSCAPLARGYVTALANLAACRAQIDGARGVRRVIAVEQTLEITPGERHLIASANDAIAHLRNTISLDGMQLRRWIANVRVRLADLVAGPRLEELDERAQTAISGVVTKLEDAVRDSGAGTVLGRVS